MDFSNVLSGEVALVTGASRGIGASIAMTLAKMGAHVVGTATTKEGVDRMHAAWAAEGVKAVGAVLDVCDAEALSHVFSTICDNMGAPSIVVNNAGIVRDNLLLRMKDDEWDAVLHTNLKSVFQLSRLCIRPMIKARYRRIINISSVVATMGNPGQANYCAAKAGLIGFSKSLALEVAGRNITVNVVAPGFIQTDMTGPVLTEAQQKAILDQIPVGHIGGAQDIADAVAFLSLRRTGYITGQTLHVNGGMWMA